MLVLFPAMPGMVGEPDPDFQAQTDAATVAGLPLALLDFEALVAGEAGRALRRVPPGDGALAVYRGWMLDPAAYAMLHVALAQRGWQLINSHAEYERCHYFPGTAALIAPHTPRAVWTTGVPDLDEIMALLAPFGNAPLVLKDWVKSRRHDPSSFFIERASDRAAVARVVGRFVAEQGPDLAGGLVFRAWLPLGAEARRFVLDGQPLLTVPDAPGGPLPPEPLLVDLMGAVRSRFWTLDLAESEGGWTVVEIGDGQVSGLRDEANAAAFYRALAARLA